MTAKIKSTLLTYGLNDSTGITYTKHDLERMVQKWESEGKPYIFGVGDGGFVDGTYVDLEKVASRVVEMKVTDTGLEVVQEILNTPVGMTFMGYVSTHREDSALALRPVISTSQAGGVAYDTKLLCISFEFSMPPNPPVDYDEDEDTE